jgi:hypothetical protein
VFLTTPYIYKHLHVLIGALLAAMPLDAKVDELIMVAGTTGRLALRKRLFNRTIPLDVFRVSSVTDANLSHNDVADIPPQLATWADLKVSCVQSTRKDSAISDANVLSLVWLAGWKAVDAHALLKSAGMDENQVDAVMSAFVTTSASAALAKLQVMLVSDGCQAEFKNILSDAIEKI